MSKKVKNANAHLPTLLVKLYEIVDTLEKAYPDRKFTPDGHLIGSIGEVIAASRYKLKLLPPSTKLHDAKSSNGKQVQIKATQGSGIGLSGEPDYLIVLSINKRGEAEEVFNGPGEMVWKACGKIQKNGQCRVSLKKLRGLASEVLNNEKIEERPSSYKKRDKA